MAPVPVKIFEDADAVYIAAEHYYELAGERKDGGRSFYDECNLVTNSLELLQDPDGFKEPYWELVVEDVHNDAELDSFIKERYFPGCSVGEQLPSLQDGVYEVRIQGDGKDLAESQCPLNFATVVKYFPAGNKVVAWDRGQSYYFPADVNYSAVYDQEMEDSFRFLTETSTETGVEPLETVGYSNEETGISFNYPTSWAMEEEANAFVFRNGPIILRVGYRMPGQTADLDGRTGMGGTGVGALEGTTQFLEQALPKYGVYYDDVLKTVVYGGEPGAKVQSGATEFSIVIDILDNDYHSLAITDEIMAEAEMILASFAVGSTQGGPVDGLNTYTNPEYGFTLHYPAAWTVEEVNDDAFVGPGSRSVQLSQGTVKLVIGYRRAGEEAAIGGSGAPGGEFDILGTVNIVGQDVERYVIVYEGKDKVVMYGQPGPPPLSAGGLEFALRMDDFNPDYDSVELSQTVQDEADMIVSSLAIIEAEGVSESEIGEFSEITRLDETWFNYTNNQLGFSINFPRTKMHYHGACKLNDEDGYHTYRLEPAHVPVMIFEDENTVYITSEYQHELSGETTETDADGNSRTFLADCQAVPNSLELLRDPDYYQEMWQIVVKDIHDDQELEAFLKARYGSSCSVGKKATSAQDGVYDVRIQGDGLDLSETQCLINYGTIVKYYPAGDRVIAWDIGQAYTFVADVSYAVAYDQEMIDSFRFLTGTTAEAPAGAVEYDYNGWLPYTNEQLGYSLMVPGAAEVVSLDPSQRVFFIGPEVDGKPQFQFGVEHYDIDSTEAANFMQSIVEGHRAFLESIGETTVGQVEELVIAGEPAIKIRFPAINESDPRDDHFFIHDGKMFTISITHIDGVEDEELNGLVLQSFAFE
jgi:hypothetical protein